MKLSKTQQKVLKLLVLNGSVFQHDLPPHMSVSNIVNRLNNLADTPEPCIVPIGFDNGFRAVNLKPFEKKESDNALQS